MRKEKDQKMVEIKITSSQDVLSLVHTVQDHDESMAKLVPCNVEIIGTFVKGYNKLYFTTSCEAFGKLYTYPDFVYFETPQKLYMANGTMIESQICHALNTSCYYGIYVPKGDPLPLNPIGVCINRKFAPDVDFCIDKHEDFYGTSLKSV